MRICNVASGELRTVFSSTTALFEAPNWTRDNRLLLNGSGDLWLLPLDGSSKPEKIRAAGLPAVNNDHVLHPSEDAVLASANDFHIYHVSLGGGAARRITPDDGDMRFLHGISPTGSHLAIVKMQPDEGEWWRRASIFEIGTDGKSEHLVAAHSGPTDGPEYSPDGQWIYFNTEKFSIGHAQIARIRRNGENLQQLTFNSRVNWFPHLSPTGSHAVYLSYPGGTEGHPADRQVRLVLVKDNHWNRGQEVARFTGGQGSINVNSWAPDGSAFAFIDYPTSESPQRTPRQR